MLYTLNEAETIQAHAMRRLNKELPLNEMGLPLGIYRVDLLDFTQYVVEQDQTESFAPIEHQSAPVPDLQQDVGHLRGVDDLVEIIPQTLIGRSERPHTTGQFVDLERRAGFLTSHLQQAFIPLSYEEGFPTLPGGQKFWDQLDFESDWDYKCFISYLQMPMDDANGGVRALANLPFQLVQLGLLEGDPSKYNHRLQASSAIHYWVHRVKSYDLFQSAAFQKQMHLRAITTQDDHYIMSRSLMGRLKDFMLGSGSKEDFWDQMTPKTAIDLLRVLGPMERVAAGLPGSAPQNQENTAGNSTSFEMILRTLAQGSNTISAESASVDAQDVLERSLSDPETAKSAQELIIRLQTGAIKANK